MTDLSHSIAVEEDRQLTCKINCRGIVSIWQTSAHLPVDPQYDYAMSLMPSRMRTPYAELEPSTMS